MTVPFSESDTWKRFVTISKSCQFDINCSSPSQYITRFLGYYNMPFFSSFFSSKPTGTLPEIDIGESLAVIMAKRKDFVIKRIPDVSYPSFFVLSSCIAVFYVTIEDTLKIFAVMENKRSPEPFVTSSRFNSTKISFKLGVHCLGHVHSKEQVAWDIIRADKEKAFTIVKSGDGVTCKVITCGTEEQHVGTMKWEAYWTESDTNVINPIDLPPNASYFLHYEIDLEATAKALILAATFTVHYSQKQIKPKKCTKKTLMIIGLAVLLLLVSFGPAVHFYSEAVS